MQQRLLRYVFKRWLVDLRLVVNNIELLAYSLTVLGVKVRHVHVDLHKSAK